MYMLQCKIKFKISTWGTEMHSTSNALTCFCSLAHLISSEFFYPILLPCFEGATLLVFISFVFIDVVSTGKVALISLVG